MHVYVLHIVYDEYIITPCTCARVKQLFCHYIIHTKIAKFQDLGILVSGQCSHDVRKGEK